MPFKIMKICQKCKNKSDLPCKHCGKRRSEILFEMACIKNHEEFIRGVHAALIRFNMESTGAASMDMEVLDCVGPWIPSLPKENPLADFYERMKTSSILHLHHLFKFRGVNYKEFCERFKAYLKEKAESIQREIELNKLCFVE
jgi:hypothetical protein